MRRGNRSGTLYRRGGVYYTKILVGGRYVRQSTGTADRDQAMKVLNSLSKGADLPEREHLAAIRVRLEEREPSPTFEEAWRRYAEAPENAGQSQGAQDTDRGRWRFFTRWLFGYDGGARCRVNQRAAFPDAAVLDDITPGVARAFFAHAKTQSAPGTVNKYVRTFKRIWRFNHAERNPWEDFRKLRENPHLRRSLTDAEVQKLIVRADGELRKLFALGAYTGARMSDCAKRRWSDFDAGCRTLTFVPGKREHNPKAIPVSVPVHPSLLDALGTPKRTGYVLPALAAYSEDKLSDLVCAHFRACGFEEGEKPDGYRRKVANVGFHSLRSTFITNMANIGAPMAMVQAIVGHMSPEMCLHYYRANAEAARARIEALPNYGKWRANKKAPGNRARGHHNAGREPYEIRLPR